MQQIKKGNQWYHGMKAHTRVDADSGLVHTARGTAANVNDVVEVNRLLHVEEADAHSDAGYQGADKRPDAPQGVKWHIARKAGKHRLLQPSRIDMEPHAGGQMRIRVFLSLLTGLASVGAWTQAKPLAATHCKADERVVFSCTFKHGKTASLCASADLSPTIGTLQYRYGVIDKPPELTFPMVEEGTTARNHPKNWFDWSSSYSTPLGKAGSIAYANTRWSTRNVPPGDSVSIKMLFTPIEGHPEVNFVIEAMAGPESRYQGSLLTIYESVGSEGRTIAVHQCIKNRTVEDLFSLKDIIQR